MPPSPTRRAGRHGGRQERFQRSPSALVTNPRSPFHPPVPPDHIRSVSLATCSSGSTEGGVVRSEAPTGKPDADVWASRGAVVCRNGAVADRRGRVEDEHGAASQGGVVREGGVVDV